jgi:CRP-like cAMP-binding protein
VTGHELEKNLLLARLSSAALDGLAPHFTRIAGKLSVELIKNERPSSHAYFPLAPTVVSLVREASDGDGVEVGLVGREGFCSITALLDPTRQMDRGIVQSEGDLLRIDAEELRRVFDVDREVRRTLMQFMNAFTMQVAQTALCNRLHKIEQRLARWLLMMRERVETDELRLTQEFLAHMLGTRIAGVNEAVRQLDRSALIRNARQRITILDPEGLEATSCECFRTIRIEYERLEDAAGMRSTHG